MSFDWLNNPPIPNALLVKIVIPISDYPKPFAFYKKIGRRETFTAAIVTVAGQVLVDSNVITDVVLAIGGGNNKPLQTKQYLQGKRVDEIHWSTIYQYILDEFKPINDPFVTSSYKKKVAANLMISDLQSFLVKSE